MKRLKNLPGKSGIDAGAVTNNPTSTAALAEITDGEELQRIRTLL